MTASHSTEARRLNDSEGPYPRKPSSHREADHDVKEELSPTPEDMPGLPTYDEALADGAAFAVPEPRVPNDVLLKVAERLFEVMSAGDFWRLVGVHRSFLHLSLSRRYEHTYLDCSHRSIRMLQHICSDPLLAALVQTLTIDFVALERWSTGLSGTEEDEFADAVSKYIPFIPGVQRLEVIWSKRRQWGYLKPYEVTPGVASENFEALLIKVFAHVAPTVEELRIDLHSEAIPFLSELNTTSAPVLHKVDLRVYGCLAVSQAPPTIDFFAEHLVSVAHSLILPLAERLATLRVYFSPGGFDPLRTELMPVGGFFAALSASHFPCLRDIAVETSFLDGEGLHIANLFTAHIRRAYIGLSDIPARPPREHPGISEFTRLIASHGSHGVDWSGLQMLSLWCPDFVPMKELIPALGSLTPVASSLRELTLTGEHALKRIEDLRLMFHALQPAPALRRLSLKLGGLISPTVLDTLAALAPPLDFLRIMLQGGRLGSDEPASDSLVNEVRKQLDARATPWQHEGDDVVPTASAVFGTAYLLPGPMRREADARTIADERQFMTGMAARRYESWALQRVSVVEEWHWYGLAEPPRVAVLLASALQRSVPGVVLTEVRPKAELPQEYREAGYQNVV